MILRHRQSPSDPMDHKTPPTYIIKNFREPHENFTPRIKYRGCGRGGEPTKSFSFSKYFLPPTREFIALLAKTESRLVFAKTKRLDFTNYARNHSYSSSREKTRGCSWRRQNRIVSTKENPNFIRFV